MHRTLFALAAAAIVLASAAPVPAQTGDATLRASLQKALNDYVASRGKPEHISTASLCISLKGAPEYISLASGTRRYPSAGAKVVPADLFQIGSNTKAFTSVAILHLEADGTLSIKDTLGKWLPQYPAWKDVTIQQLLHMVSPIPGYDNVPKIENMMGKEPNHRYTPKELVAAAYPHDGEPKPVSGWTYSNTNYVLSQMIVEKAARKPYADVLRGLFSQVGLKTTYYEQYEYPAAILDRMVSGYFFNHDPDNAALAPLLGRDMKDMNVSWMQGAGGIVSTPCDVATWSRALYEGPLLAKQQRAELETVVSQKTGEPMAGAKPGENGFGLGVGQSNRPPLGLFWFYEGMTLGYRMLYAYVPSNGAVIVVGLNSQPDSKQNHSGKLLEQIYGILQKARKL